MPYITKQYKFCAAHRYWNPQWSDEKNNQVFDQDVKIHGHNYLLEIKIIGPINKESGFIINLQELNSIVYKYVIDVMDHSQIEKDILWFKNKQPSTENMVIFIWEQICQHVSMPARLHSVKLQETPTIYTEYFGPGEEHE